MEAAPVGHEGDQGEGEGAARQRVADAQQGALGEVPEIMRGNKWGYSSCGALLGPEMILVCGLVKFVPAVAYHFCLNLPATFSQPRTSIISGPSTEFGKIHMKSDLDQR